MPYPELLPWYDINRRKFPFRGTKDPYAIWVSEIMLQQTRTESVEKYYTRFLSRFPTISSLAEATEQDILKYWEGLGYYSRARNLHKASRLIMTEYSGVFPDSYDKIRRLPGVGEYTAAAVSSIAFGLPFPAVDGNLTRVLSRLHGVRDDTNIPSVKKHIRDLAMQNIDTQRPGDWNQALMDLGATLCLPAGPACKACPLKGRCSAFAEGDADLLPVRSSAKPPVPVAIGVGIVTCHNKVLLLQRSKALLHGLWTFLLCENDSRPEGMIQSLSDLGFRGAACYYLGDARHVFTHRIWNMKLYHIPLPEPYPCQEGIWADSSQLESLPMPSAMKKALALARSLITEKGDASC